MMIVASVITPSVSAEETEQQKPKEYVVIEGDYLDKIATAHGTTWQRIFDKNTHIENPDHILVGEKVIIPAPEEVMPDRTIAPAVPVEAPEAVSVPKKHQEPLAPVTSSKRSYGGSNTYTPGQCTWHVKNLKPSLPNNLGNASEWYRNAQRQGLATGTTPQVGAAAPRKYGNHVVYVKAVNGDGTITVSEMNYNWTPYATRTTVKPASDYYYIY